jgi:hypothetical protein
MAIKVVPGSITEPYKVGKGDFSPNLVGNQITDGTTLFTLGNFALTTNPSIPISKVYNTGSFSESYSLENLNLTLEESEVLSNQSINIILNLDPSNLDSYVYFGSFFEYIRTTIEQILLKWKGSLYAYYLLDNDPDRIPRNTVLSYTYDSVTDTSSFLMPVAIIKNNFGLIYEESVAYTVDIKYGDIANLNNFYYLYQISNIFGDFPVVGFTGSTPNYNYINLEVKGNIWPNLVNVGFGSFNYHMRPKEEILNKYFFNLLTDFESTVLDRLTTPKYTASFKVPKKTDAGTQFNGNVKITWPTTDGYNLDNSTAAFNTYVNAWLDVAKQIDEAKTDLIARRFITSSIIEFDTEGDGTDVYGRKVNKLLRIYGREFDEIKKHIDSISFARSVTYNKKENTPDELIKILASELGLDVLLSFFDNNLFGDVLPTNSSSEGYGNPINVPFSGYSRNLSPKEIDIELWRRLVINAWWLFKSKGHRKVLEFFLNLFGIQKCVVSLDEYIYIAKERLDPTEALNVVANYLGIPVEDLSSANDVNFINGGLPLDSYGFPSIPTDNDGWYYQMMGFWYNGGNLSEIGNNPHIGPYDYGTSYLRRLRCFIDDFNGLTTGTTTFTTLENVFTDYNNGDIESGVINYGDNFAEIMNSSNMISTNATVLLAGSSQNISYGNSNSSLRITFTYGGSNCELTCPSEYVNYFNGIIFATDLIPNSGVNPINLTGVTEANQEDLILASNISEFCCGEIGGYYLPVSVSEPFSNCPEIGQLMFLSNGLVVGIDNQECCNSTVVGTNVNWNGSQCFLAGSNTNSVPEVFSPQEIFNNQEEALDNFVCYWCPPSQVLCGEEYYNSIPQNKQLSTGPGKGDGGGGGGPLVYGCNIGPLYTESNGVSYQIMNYNPLVDALCPEFYTQQWTQVSPTEWSRGCCLAKVYTPTPGGNTGGPGGPLTVNDLFGPEIVTPCSGPFTIQNDIVFNGANPAKIKCCTQGLVGQPVIWNGVNCVLLQTEPIESCLVSGITSQGIVQGINSSSCCTQEVVGQPVIWNGTNCTLISPDFCVITSINGQNITNPDCCNAKNGYLGVDALGQTVCLKTSLTSNNPNTDLPLCPQTYSYIDFEQDNHLYTEVLDFDGTQLSNNCCINYSNTIDPNYYYDITIKKCVKKEVLELKACRFDLIETYMSLKYPNYHYGSNVGIYGLEERVYIKITKLEINGFDYITNNSIIPQTILDSAVISPDKWNSALFLQKTFNTLNVNNYKSQLPGNPANISNTPDTLGLITQVFDEGYGLYIIYPQNDSFKIEFKIYTQSDSTNTHTLTYTNQGILISDLGFSDKLKSECGYDATKTLSPMNENCYKVSNIQFGIEPEQCYPFVLGGNTYI